tara:strand:+ start:2125 stop:2628 length:504 start_codon:yes stop_codon:yes gene_type:complete
MPVVNKVALKAIVKIDLESYIPKAADTAAFDIKGFLFKELLLKEKDFRQSLKEYDFSALKDKYVYIHCSNAAIVPLWAYMLLTTYINPIAKLVIFTNSSNDVEEQFVLKAIDALDLSVYENQRVIVKGCAEKTLSPLVYTSLVCKLQDVVKTIMFGEACSMLPVFKK